jgi:hypothetical protein
MITTMISFEFEEQCSSSDQIVSHGESLVAWMPIILLDWSIVTFLIGFLVWYGSLEGQSRYGIGFITVQVVGLLTVCCLLSLKMFIHMSKAGGLGPEDPHQVVRGKVN